MNEDNKIVVVVPTAVEPARSREQVGTLIERIKELKDALMIEGVHYGSPHPGADKPALLKPGAELLCAYFGLSPRVEIIYAERVLQGPEPYVYYEVKCKLTIVANGEEAIVGEGFGSATSLESKHRFRTAERVCPECGAPAIIRGKPEFGGGWVCWRNVGGCGAKFAADDPRIIGQPTGKVRNEQAPDTFNAVLKAAKKRAIIDAVLGATGASFLFTQDEDVLDALFDGSQIRSNVAIRGTAEPAPSASQPPQEEKRATPAAPSPASKSAARPTPPQKAPKDLDPDEPWQQVIAKWDQKDWAFYWQTLRDKGLTSEEVHQALGVETVKAYTGTRGTHNQLIARAIEKKKADSQQATLAKVEAMPGFELDEYDLTFYVRDDVGKLVPLARQTLRGTKVLEMFPETELPETGKAVIYEDGQDIDYLAIAHWQPAPHGGASVERVEYRHRLAR